MWRKAVFRLEGLSGIFKKGWYWGCVLKSRIEIHRRAGQDGKVQNLRGKPRPPDPVGHGCRAGSCPGQRLPQDLSGR